MPLITAENRLEFAHRALEAYDLHPAELTFLNHGENVTFHVQAAEGAFLLRIHQPINTAYGDHGTEKNIVESEMIWLAALSAEHFPVPTPVVTLRNELIARVERTNVTLLKWQDGEMLTRDMENEYTAAGIGELIGRLHKQSSQWETPVGFSRPLRGAAYFENSLLSLWPAVQDGRIDSQDFKSLQHVINWLIGQIRSLSPSRDIFGLIHGDLHRGNFLVGDNRIKLIDFSMSAYGHYAYDLSTCLSNMREVYRPIFIDHYTRYFSLPPDYQRLIEAYFLGSWVATFALWIPDDNLQETLVQRVPLIAGEYAERFNQDERFWFSNDQ